MPRPVSSSKPLALALEDVEAQEAGNEMKPEEAAALTLYYRAKLALKEREVTGATLH
jgi:hypothetical protein